MNESKSNILTIVITFLVFVVAGTPTQTQSPVASGSDETAVRRLVERFGKRVPLVTLSASKEIVAQQIGDNYGSFITPALLAEWIRAPSKAPGRSFSSPWPDRLEILKIQKLANDRYQADAEIIEITSWEVVHGGFAGKKKVRFVVEKLKDRWLISGFSFIKD